MARPAPAASRAIQILDLLVTHPAERFTLTELVRRTGMSLGSAHAVLAVLERSGHVRRHPVTKAYTLGPALVVAGVVALEHHPGIDAARRALSPLAEELGVGTVLTARTTDEIIFVARAGRHTATGPDVREGERVPFVPPFGTVFLAWSDTDEIDRWLARATRPTPDLVDRARVALAAVRHRGTAVTFGTATQRALGERALSLAAEPSRHDLREDVNVLTALLATEDYPLVDLAARGPFDIGMIAAPVFDADANVIAAVSAFGFPEPLDGDALTSAIERVRSAGARATRESRGRMPDATSVSR